MREYTNKYLSPIRKLFIIDVSFTIISNNCWAGHVYRYCGINYNTPTVGLYLFSSDYLRFLKRLKYYISESPNMKFISYEESKFSKILEERNQTNVPIGVIDDIEIIFLHYENSKEAYDKWNRRCKRINWNNLIVKNMQGKETTIEEMHEYDQLEFTRKFIFTSKDYGLNSQVIFSEWDELGFVANDTTLFKKYINIINLLNNKPYKLRQNWKSKWQ